MELNQIPQNPNNWGNVADLLNDNSGKIEAETAKLNNATTKFKGYFTTSTALSAKWPSPLVGDTAWVGATYPGVVYRCNVAGTWLATTGVPPSNTVNLSEYATQDAVSNEFASVRSDLSETTDKLTELENTTIKKGYSFEKTNNDIDSITKYDGGIAIMRANMFNGELFGIAIKAIKADINIEYGILKSTGESSKLGTFKSKVGMNYVVFDSPISCNPDTQEIYLLSFDQRVVCATDENGIGMFQFANGTFEKVEGWEIACYGVKNFPLRTYLDKSVEYADTKLPLESLFVKTNNPYTSISKYPTGGAFKRANAFNGDFVGIRIWALTNGIVEYGTMTKEGVCTKLGTKILVLYYNSLFTKDQF